jgi:hypothetical protein
MVVLTVLMPKWWGNIESDGRYKDTKGNPLSSPHAVCWMVLFGPLRPSMAKESSRVRSADFYNGG